jgi:hypothetical protein
LDEIQFQNSWDHLKSERKTPLNLVHAGVFLL